MKYDDSETPKTDAQHGPHGQNHKAGGWMIYLMWAALLTVVALLMQNWLDRQYNPNRHLVVNTSSEGTPQVILTRNRYGHYVSPGYINGEEAVFFLDTGATDVVIPAEIADKYGLKRGPAYQASTANGIVTVYATKLDLIELGPLQLRNIRASINPHMDGEEILLGMSFLKHLELTQRKDQLIIRAPD
ncbi:MAG TPA: TIGR02281 family clan AA aspartic protease [Gammaproteobacteria bacterium]